MPKFYHRAPEPSGIYGKMPRFSNPANVFARPRMLNMRGYEKPLMSQQADADPMTETVALKIVQRIATELTVQPRQVAAAVQLLDEGSTVPFIARYRKEVTDNLDDTQLRNLEERLLYLRELEDRRATIVQSIDEQGKLTRRAARSRSKAPTASRCSKTCISPINRSAARARRSPAKPACSRSPTRCSPTRCSTRKPKPRVTWTPKKASPTSRPRSTARATSSRSSSAKPPKCSASCATTCSSKACVISTVVEGKETEEDEKFRDYYDYSETIRTVPSHRALALFRGRNAGVLMVKLGLGEELDAQVPHPGEALIARHVGIANQGRPADKWLSDVCRWCWRVKVQPHIENELLTQSARGSRSTRRSACLRAT